MCCQVHHWLLETNFFCFDFLFFLYSIPLLSPHPATVSSHVPILTSPLLINSVALSRPLLPVPSGTRVTPTTIPTPLTTTSPAAWVVFCPVDSLIWP